eukprot:TRINITY_DN14208_c0_g1_i2.p1 TRINITY_DN14208_c0_g1~~TRINITY_DN14208_c0_g1_i2.p1  ORF type:complete len:134 (-),score=24.21 TRINITY_DN14208_c0_g1_i2:52-453(-)
MSIMRERALAGRKESLNDLGAVRSKRVLSYMHQKSFFQGVASCFLAGCCRVNENLTLPSLPSKETPLDHNKLAKEMLKYCGVIRRKHYRASNILRQGEGSLSFIGGVSFNDKVGNLSDLLNRRSRVTLLNIHK